MADSQEVQIVPVVLADWRELNRRVHLLSLQLRDVLEAQVEEAPTDGQRYVRRDGAWEVLP